MSVDFNVECWDNPTIFFGWRDMNYRIARPLLVLLILVSGLSIGLFVVPATSVYAICAPSVVVTSLNDSGSNTLRDAMNFLCPDGTITFSGTGTITLASSLPTITKNMTITGPSAPGITIDGANLFRLISVNPGVTVTLNTLTFANGLGLNDAGAISNQGTLNITFSTFSNNVAPSGGLGGAIENFGTLNVTSTVFNSNSAAVNGGAIYNSSGDLNLNGNFFNVNTTSGSGGAIYVASGVITSTDNRFGLNQSASDGGALYLQGGTLTMRTNNFASNGSTGGAGGGVYISGGNADISGSTFQSNTASGGGGGLSNSSVTKISASTFYSNSASNGGGIMNQSVLTMSNSTIFKNKTTSLAGGTGIDNFGGLAVIINTTISRNISTSGVVEAVLNAFGTMTITNTILDTNTGGNCFNNSGTLADGGNNLRWPNTDATCFGSFGDPKLGPLQNYGTFSLPTLALGLLTGSAAIDTGNDTVCAAPPINAVDQRGVHRPIGSHCDIGAYEGTIYLLFFPLITR